MIPQLKAFLKQLLCRHIPIRSIDICGFAVIETEDFYYLNTQNKWQLIGDL